MCTLGPYHRPFQGYPSPPHSTSPLFISSSCSSHSVRTISIFGPFELHFQSFHADLEAIHGLNGGLSAGRVVETHKSFRTKIKIRCGTQRYTKGKAILLFVNVLYFSLFV